MKTPEEMASRVIEKRDAQIKLRKSYTRLAVVFAGVAGLLLLSLLAPKLGKKNDSNEIAKVPVTNMPTSTVTNMPAKPTSEPTVIPTSQPERVMLWGGKAPSTSNLSTLGTIIDLPATGMPPGLFESDELTDVSNAVTDDTFVVFTIKVRNHSAKVPELWAAYYTAENNAIEVYQKAYKDILNNNDITSSEAGARAMSRADVIAAYEEKQVKYQSIMLANMDCAYNYFSDELKKMEEEGLLQIIATANDENYREYLAVENGVAVCAATTAQLHEIIKRKVKCHVMLMPAWEEADSYRFPPYTYADMLAEDSKLTNQLLAAYQANGGASIVVEGHIGYIGEPIDAHAMAYAAIGMTAEEYNNSINLSNEVVDLYIKTLNEYVYMKPYQRELLQRVLKSDELIEQQEFMWSFTAKLTYERALELVENKEIAYLGLPKSGLDLFDYSSYFRTVD